MPSSESVSLTTRSVVLTCSSTEPDRKMPYSSRNSKFVWKAATPQNSTLEKSSPTSSTNLAAAEARLPSL